MTSTPLLHGASLPHADLMQCQRPPCQEEAAPHVASADAAAVLAVSLPAAVDFAAVVLPAVAGFAAAAGFGLVVQKRQAGTRVSAQNGSVQSGVPESQSQSVQAARTCEVAVHGK